MACFSYRLPSALIVLWISSALGSHPWLGPAPTVSSEHLPDVFGWTPRPTAAPAWPDLAKRQNSFHTLCGFINGNASDTVGCYEGYCGYNTLSSTPVIGCCLGTYVSAGSNYLSDCYYETTCYDYGVCDSSCASVSYSSAYGSCTSSDYPHCAEVTFAEGGGITFRCTDVPSLTLTAEYTYTNQGGFSSATSSTLLPQSSSSTSTVAPSTATSSANPMPTSPTPVPFTQSQATAVPTSTQSAPVSTSTVSASNKCDVMQSTKIGTLLLVALLCSVLV